MADNPQSNPMTIPPRKATMSLMERRKQIQFNRCMNELKKVVEDSFETEDINFTHLERVEILELIVNQLLKLYTLNSSGLSLLMPINTKKTYETPWRSGLHFCSIEALEYVAQLRREDEKFSSFFELTTESLKKFIIQNTPSESQMSPSTSQYTQINPYYLQYQPEINLMSMISSKRTLSPWSWPLYIEESENSDILLVESPSIRENSSILLVHPPVGELIHPIEESQSPWDPMHQLMSEDED